MDNRKFQSAASATPPTAPVSPSSGYPTNGNPATGTPATLPGEYWFHQIGEELRTIIAAAALTPDKANLTQLLTALRSAGVFTTPAQFDNSTLVSTTAFVNQAIGNFSNGISYTANANIAPTVAGAWVYFNAANITLKLPLLASCAEGTAIYFSGNGVSGNTIGVQGSDVIFAGSVHDITSMALNPNDTAIFVNKTQAWYLLAGEARLSYSAFPSSIGISGYLKLPGGLVYQWGSATTSGTVDVTVTYPIAFPTGCLNIVFGAPNITSAGGFICGNTTNVNNFKINGWINSTTRAVMSASWHAIGY
jgi:hypothetical protein